MIFKQETIKSWFSGVGTSVNNEVIQPFQNANSVISKYNLAIQHNSLTQQGWQRLLAQSDDSLKAYLTSIKGSTASMAGYNVSLQGSITGFTKVSNAIKQYNALGAVSLKEQQAFATAVGATNAKLGSYLIGLNGSTAGLRGYGVSLVTSTAKTIGLTVATTALNAAMTMGISVIVTGLISAFTAWINKSEEITEKAQETADKINSISESLKTNTETVENAKKRYAELAQEIENLGKITQSQGTLSNEEYEEFLDLSNQLAGIFPSLTKNYDENGNAILDLSGDVNTIVGSLDDLIQKEKELANQQIMEEFPDVFKGYVQDVDNAEQKVKSAQKEFDDINQAYNALGKGQSVQMAFNENGANTDIDGNITMMGQYESWLKTLGLTYKETKIQGGKLVTAVGNINTAFASKLEAARKNLQYEQQQLEGEKSSIDSYLNTWLQGEFSYVQIDDSGLQTAIQDMLFNFDFSNIPENKRGDWNYVSEYLRRNILFEINKVQDDPVISKAISEVFSNTELTPNEKANYLQQIQDYFGEDSSIVVSLKPQIDETGTLQKQYDDAINKFTVDENEKEKVRKELESFNQEDTIDFTIRPKVDTSELEKAGWGEQEPGTATVFSSTYYSEDFGLKEGKSLVVTPILPDGTVLSPEQLDEYARKLLSGEKIDADIKMGLFEGENYKEDADEFANKIHELHEKYFVNDSYFDLGQFFADNSINTTEEIDYWNKVTEGAESAEEAVRMYNEAKSKNPDEITVLNLSEWLNTEENDKAVEDFKSKIEKIQGYINDINNISSDELFTIADDLDNMDLLKIDISTPEGIEKLKKALQELETNELSALNKMLKKDCVEGAKEFKQALEDMVAGVNNSGMSMEELQAKFENSRSSISELQQILSDLSDKESGSDYINTIASKYPQLLQYIDDETELRKHLNLMIDEQKQIAAQAYTDMMSSSEEYYDYLMDAESAKVEQINDSVNLIIKSNATLVDVLGKNYKVDLNNFQSIVNAKAQLEKELIKNSASAWAKYYKVQIDATTGLATAAQKDIPIETDEHGVPVVPQERVDAYNAANDAVNGYNKAIEELNNLSNNINIPISSAGTSANKNKDSKSSAENFSEQIDWCAQSISVLTANLQKLQSELENTQGWDKQIAKLKEIYKTNKNLTNSYKTNYKAYKNYYDKVTKKYASTYKKYGAKIEKGETFSIENFKGKNEQKTYNQIQKMIEAYNNYQSAYNQYLDQKVAQQEAKDDVYQKQADKQSAIIESKQALLENTKSYSKQKKIIEDIMSATANQYKYELKLAKTQYEKNKLFQEYLTNMQELGKQSAEEYWTAKDEKIEKYDNRNEVLNATLENTSGADAKNTIADQILKNEKSKLKQQRSSVKTAKSEKNELYDKIDKKYKNNVDENGRIVLDNITNISEAQLKYISKYNGFVDTLVEKEQELATSEQEYITAKADSIITHANNIIADTDKQIALIESKQSALENYRSLVEAKGNSVAKGYYEDQIAYEKQSAERMEETRKQLVQQLNLLETGSDKWFEVFGMIENCDQSIADSTLKTQEFANAIKEIDLTVFENLKNDFETLAGEADFLIELMSDSEMTKSIGDKELKQLIKDGDFDSIRDMFSGSGLDSLTEDGMATVGLHGASYNAYMNEAYEIQKKRNELAKEMSEDETKNTEENKKLLAEYDKSLQETTLKAYSEGKAAVDIVKQGYQDQLNILQEIIDAKKKSLDAEKKIYDYQKNIKSQTKNIMSLRMQLDAWSNVDTEEAKNKVQQLQVEIEDAETELEETVYDQYLSDYEELMDEFYSEYEDMISGYLDNTNALLSDILAAVNGGESSVSKTLESLASTFGITLSETMKGIFNADDGKNALGIDLNASTKPNADTGAGSVAQNFEDNSNKEQEKKEEEYRKESAPPVPVTPESTKKDVNNEPDVVWPDVINVTNPSELKDANIKTGVLEEAPEVVSQPLTYATDLSEIKKYINSKASKTDTNKNKLSDLNKYIYDKTNGKILSKKEISVLGNKYLGLNTSDNPSTKEKNAILKALKKSGYSNGGFADELNKVVKENGDDGIVTLQRKELVLTKAQSNDYLKLMDNLDTLNNMFDYAAMSMQNDMLKNLTPIPNASVLNNATVPQQINAEFNFTLPNVTDTSSFLKAIQTDNNIQKAIQNVSVGRLGGSGKLSVNRFK